MSDEVFVNEYMVILTSKIEIDCNEWLGYIKGNWENLMRKNTRFLTLAGIHGKENGMLGSRDNELLLDYDFAIKSLLKIYKDDIKEKNIQIFLEDVGSHFNSSKLDEEKFVNVVKKHKPTIISLAFCFTDKSELNDILRASGIYSILILTQDKVNIMEDKYVVLDEAQRKIIEKVALEQPKNIVLWGSSGTGKTLLLTQALSIKISHFKKQEYKGEKYKLNVIISSYFAENNNVPLMQDLKTKYLSHLCNEEYVRFIDFSTLCKGNNKILANFSF